MLSQASTMFSHTVVNTRRFIDGQEPSEQVMAEHFVGGLLAKTVSFAFKLSVMAVRPDLD